MYVKEFFMVSRYKEVMAKQCLLFPQILGPGSKDPKYKLHTFSTDFFVGVMLVYVKEVFMTSRYKEVMVKQCWSNVGQMEGRNWIL